MTAPPPSLADALQGRYTLKRELGRGGMATVYLAHDLRHDRAVALKVLHPELAETLGPTRFQREIRLAARLQHPHILTVLDSGEAAGQLWFTMPFVEGESLRDRLRRERQLSVDNALRIATEVARALEYAHQHGIIHRDIKPENLLLTSDGSTLVADFGIARAVSASTEQLTETGLAVGTPAYMSPEQAAGDRGLDARTDVYALGTVLYEMLVGEPPYTGATAQAMIARRFSDAVPRVRTVRPSVSEALEHVVRKALALVPADRFASAAEFAQALASPAASGPTMISEVTQPPKRFPSRPPPARWRVPVALLVGLGLVVLGGLGRQRSPRGDAAPAGATGPKRLAVLPFENLGDSADAYFADVAELDVSPVPRGVYLDRHGARMRALYKFPSLTQPVLKGDELCPCIKIQNTYDGTSRIAIHIGAFRFVCTNLAVGGGGVFASGFMAIHAGEIDIDQIAQKLKDYLAGFAAITNLYRAWTEQSIGNMELEWVIRELPTRPAKILLEELLPSGRRSVWEAYNAATHFATHRMRSVRTAFDLLDRINRGFQTESADLQVPISPN